MSSKPIDEKIAKLSLDSDQFEQNASKAVKTFEKMNQIFSKSSDVNLSGLESSVNSISSRFTLLGNIGQAAFQRIANTVLNLAGQLNNIFGVGGAMAGYGEYELKLNSIQTIMVNTGESIGNVSDALNELNTYADQTIYSFSDMTRNIGLFTAAGVDLQTSVSSIKGLANLAAGMGVDNSAAARATWQLSQALGTGYVRLQDWMSVENAGLGGTYFQKALVEQAQKVGTLSMSYDELKDKYGSFRNSLTEGKWLTNDVLAGTLENFANDETLQDAATKVKSFSQLMDTVQESIGSGWAQTWELIFGNLEEAKEFWTPISDAISGFINDSSNARNEFISKWKDLGGLEATINGIKNIFTGLKNLFTPIKDGFKNLIPKDLAERLANTSKRFEELTKKFAEADFSSFSSVVKTAFDAIGSALSGFASGVGGIGGVVSTLIGWFGQIAGSITGGLADSIAFVIKNLTPGKLFGAFASVGAFKIANQIANTFKTINNVIKTFTKSVSESKEKLSFWDSLSGMFSNVGSSLQNLSKSVKIGSVVAIAAAVGILASSIEKLSKINGGAVAASVAAIGLMMGELSGTFIAMEAAISKFGSKGTVKAAASMILIAEAVKVLASAISTLAVLNTDQLAAGLFATALGLTALVTAMIALENTKVSLKTSVAILAVAKACQMLATAVKSMGQTNWRTLEKGLVGMGVALAEVVAAVSILGKTAGYMSLIGSVSILIAVHSLDEIATALQRIGYLGWEQIKKGLVAMGGALAEIAVITGALGELAGLNGLLGAATIVLAVQALQPIADALYSIGNLGWKMIARGLVGIGGALTELAVVSGILGSTASFSGLIGAATVVLAAQALEPIAEALSSIGNMSWVDVKQGLIGMGAALAELAIVSGATGALTGLAGLVGAGTIALAAQGLGDLADAFIKFGGMDWNSVGTAIAAMGAALTETAIGGLMNTFSGFGADAIAKMAAPLGTLADSVSKWKDVTVPEGLGTQLGNLAEGVMSFTFGGFGADALATAAAPLGTMAKSVKKWKDVTVPEGIGNQLEQLANGVKKFTFAGFGAGALEKAAAPLGTLAKSVKKWDGVTVPEGIDTQLQALSDGVKAFSLAFIGGWSLGAVTGPLGDLAKSVKKWNGVAIPEGLGTALTNLAEGIKSFTGVDVTNFPSLESLTPSLETISGAATKLAEIDFSGATANLTAFVNGLTGIPEQITAVGTSMSTAASTITTNFSNNFNTGLTTMSSKAVATIKSMFTTIKSNVTSNGNSIGSTFTTIGTQWMNKLKSGIQNGKSTAVSATKSVMTACANAVKGKYGEFYQAGLQAMQGLTAGINAGGAGAISAAANVAARALAAARKALDERSPSKKFEQVGLFADQGLANGFNNGLSEVISSAKNMANTALGTVNDILSGDSLALQPTISPMIDSSAMQSINDMSHLMELKSVLQDKNNQNIVDPQMKTNQLIQTLINKYDSLIDKLNDVDFHLTVEPQELDGESIADAIDEVYKVRDLLSAYGKGGA